MESLSLAVAMMAWRCPLRLALFQGTGPAMKRPALNKWENIGGVFRICEREGTTLS